MKRTIIIGVFALALITAVGIPAFSRGAGDRAERIAELPAVSTTSSSAPALDVETFSDGGALRFFDTTEVDTAISTATDFAEIESALAPLEAAYDYQVDIPTSSGQDQIARWTASDEVSDLDAMKRAAASVARETAKLPQQAVRDLAFDRVTLVDDLYFADRDPATDPGAGGITNGAYIYLIAYPEDQWFRRSFNHEFAHVMQFSYPDAHATALPAYSAANPPSFTYTGAQQGEGEHPQPGFMDAYSTTTAIEDEANDWAYLQTQEHYFTTMGWLESDATLRAKIDALVPVWQTFDPTFTLERFAEVNR